MTAFLTLLASVGAFGVAERRREYLFFGLTAFAALIAIILLVVNDLQISIALASLLAAAIIGTSGFKFNLSGFKLSASDVPLLFAGTMRFVFVQYRRMVALFLLSALCLVIAAVSVLTYVVKTPVPLEHRLGFLVFAIGVCGLTYWKTGVAEKTRATLNQNHSFFSSFIASLVQSCSFQRAGTLRMSDISNIGLPLCAPIAARCTRFPDILIIQHESLFDPRTYGLPVDDDIGNFLSPSHGIHGGLNVDIFGGGSWQSEFSLLTGLSSASFGRDSYHLYKRGAGRFAHSLPDSLGKLGYDTTLAAACRRDFLNYNLFYSSIGMKERVFTDDLPAPFDLDAFEKSSSDAMFLEAATDVLSKKLDTQAAPQFLYALTNFNHGPHDIARTAPGRFEAQRAFAYASLPDAQYAEYYARLSETAATWRAMKARLASRHPDRPMLILHYGDHQPVMVRRIQKHLRRRELAERQFRTFYAIETLNMDEGALTAKQGADLDIAYLSTLVLQLAGLPLDEIYATRASLFDECGVGYFLSTSARKRQFHRTLVDAGLIKLEAP
jgi:hypothetical protein